MAIALPDSALKQLFSEARTFQHWQNKPVPESTLHQLYELLKFGPTAANGCPARFIFITSPEAKQRLKSCLSEGNIEKTMSAPVTVIIAQDMEFYEKLDVLFPFTDARSWFAGNDALIAEAAMRNSSLQGAYLMLAARALGLDCGPMSGFDAAKLNQAFFAGQSLKANFLCNLGFGDRAKLPPRAPRLPFDEACKIL
ncbi:MAG TPA: malonic semialdehyde reductase [Pseudomonadales bacterium]|nr:malonic semialdehyde reductase [Pseudomonadales bacterium]